MSNLAIDTRDATPVDDPPAETPAEAPAEISPGISASAEPDEAVGRIPAVTIDAFCETAEMAAEMDRAARHRRMNRATLTSRIGGVGAAIAQYREAPTPNLIVLESRAGRAALIADLEALAEVCDADTKVVVVGAANDIELYREIIGRGVSEYLPAPVEAPKVISTIARVFSVAGAQKLGRVYAFIGAKGGVGSSMIAHNIAWTLGRDSGGEVLLADLDLPFGTASLNFDLEPTSGIADAVRGSGRLDHQMLDRLLTRADEHLQLLAAPAQLDSAWDLEGEAFDAVLDLAQTQVSHVVLDMPHIWTGWARRVLLAADEVVITATPDLASLKHTRHLVEVLAKARPDAPPPRLVLNQVGMPKRPEIDADDFAEAAGVAPSIVVPFDAQTFGTAANDGRMVADVARRSPAPAAFRQLAETLSGRARGRKRGFLGLDKLFARKAAKAAKAGKAAKTGKGGWS